MELIRVAVVVEVNPVGLAPPKGGVGNRSGGPEYSQQTLYVGVHVGRIITSVLNGDVAENRFVGAGGKDNAFPITGRRDSSG